LVDTSQLLPGFLQGLCWGKSQEQAAVLSEVVPECLSRGAEVRELRVNREMVPRNPARHSQSPGTARQVGTESKDLRGDKGFSGFEGRQDDDRESADTCSSGWVVGL